MKITVTEKHISLGFKNRMCECPIALAMKEQFKESVNVWPEFVVYKDNTGSIVVDPLPEAARTFIDRFDEGLPVDPFEFELESYDDPELAAKNTEFINKIGGIQ